MSVHLQARLVDLRRNLLAMGAEVESRVASAVEAMRNADVELARRIRAGDLSGRRRVRRGVHRRRSRSFGAGRATRSRIPDG